MAAEKKPSNVAPKAHDWILDLAPYVPGSSKVEGVSEVVKLSSNESLYGPSPAALKAAADVAGNLLRYSDPTAQELRNTIAEVHGLNAANIICGTGSGEILSMITHCFAGPGDEVIFSEYGFSLYELQTNAVGATGVVVPNKNWAADVDGILEAVTEDTKLIFVDNPNNPTGSYVCWDEIERLHANLPEDVLLVLDAAYAECVTAEDYKAGECLVDKFDNVMVTRTFSKMYGLAGLRVGWAYAPPAIVDVLNRIRLPFNVSMHGQAAATAAMNDQSHLQAAAAFTAKWRDSMAEDFKAMGLDVVDSQANFLLVAFPQGERNAEACYAFLSQHGFIVRELPSLPGHLRISIGAAEHNQAFLSLTAEFLGKK
ncbi:MAG: histidinol-phosphate transaminase [Kordiimonas sp.]